MFNVCNFFRMLWAYEHQIKDIQILKLFGGRVKIIIRIGLGRGLVGKVLATWA